MRNIQETLSFENPYLKVRCWMNHGKMSAHAPYSHWHDLVEIVWNRKGSGLQQINQTIFTVQEGTMSVIGQNQLHSYAACSADEEMELLVLQFDVPSLLDGFLQKDKFCADWLSESLLFPNAVPVAGEMGRLLETVYAEMQHQNAGYVQAVTGCLLQLLSALYRQQPVKMPAADRKAFSEQQNRKLLSEVFVFLSEHFQEEGLSLEKAAKASNLSVTHFCRLFRQATGLGFHQYLNQYRVSRAEQLLSSGRSLADTAFACGFGSLSAFTRNYKKYRGCSPRTARKKLA